MHACMQANKRHIQVLDYHLHSFLLKGSDAKVISTYFTGSWTIDQPSLTPCASDCGLHTCSHSLQSMSSALTDVTFLHLHPRGASSTVAHPLVPLGPGTWDPKPLQTSADTDNDIVVASSAETQSASTSAPVATAITAEDSPSGAPQECAQAGRTNACAACIDVSGSLSTEHTRRDSGIEELLEDVEFVPPHGAVSMEFRRVRGNAACMTERVRRAVLNSIPRNMPTSNGGQRCPGAAADACMCLEGLWCETSCLPSQLLQSAKVPLQVKHNCLKLWMILKYTCQESCAVF